MPLYEFYCVPCHTLFTFHARRVVPEARPPCPVCGGTLRKEVSPFAAILHAAKDTASDDGTQDGDIDPKTEQLLAQMGDHMEALADDDADPGEAARFMREMAESGGLTLKAEVAEALARIEAGEDPEKIEETFREVLEGDSPFAASGDAVASGRAAILRLRPPRRDPAWHELPLAGP